MIMKTFEPFEDGRPLSREQYAEALRELHEVTEPFVHAKCGILSVARPTWRFHQDGTFEQTNDGMTAELREAMRKLTEMQDAVSREFMRRVATCYLDAVVTGTGFVKLPPNG